MEYKTIEDKVRGFLGGVKGKVERVKIGMVSYGAVLVLGAGAGYGVSCGDGDEEKNSEFCMEIMEQCPEDNYYDISSSKNVIDEGGVVVSLRELGYSGWKDFCEDYCVRPNKMRIEECAFAYCSVETGYCDEEVKGDLQIEACMDKHGWMPPYGY